DLRSKAHGGIGAPTRTRPGVPGPVRQRHVFGKARTRSVGAPFRSSAAVREGDSGRLLWSRAGAASDDCKATEERGSSTRSDKPRCAVSHPETVACSSSRSNGGLPCCSESEKNLCVDPRELAARRSELFHMAELDAWPMIQKHGLLS